MEPLLIFSTWNLPAHKYQSTCKIFLCRREEDLSVFCWFAGLFVVSCIDEFFAFPCCLSLRIVGRSQTFRWLARYELQKNLKSASPVRFSNPWKVFSDPPSSSSRKELKSFANFLQCLEMVPVRRLCASLTIFCNKKVARLTRVVAGCC